MIAVEMHIADELDLRQVEAARRQIAQLDRYTRRPPVAARLTLGPLAAGAANRYGADASILYNGRQLAAHGIGRTPCHAAELAARQLRRQVRRLVGSEIALRNELRDNGVPRVPAVRPKPPDEREIVPCHTYADRPLGTIEGVSDLIDDGELFYLFRHVRSSEDVVVHWRRDQRIALLFPPGSILADEEDVVVPTRSRYGDPLTLRTARAEMEVVEHRFLYFLSAQDGRGRVLYRRGDGDYGLVLPP